MLELAGEGRGGALEYYTAQLCILCLILFHNKTEYEGITSLVLHWIAVCNSEHNSCGVHSAKGDLL